MMMMIIWAYLSVCVLVCRTDGGGGKKKKEEEEIDYGIREPRECAEGYYISEGNSGICNPDRNSSSSRGRRRGGGLMEISFFLL